MSIARHSERGQTILEMVVAMPIVLFTIFAIIYMARFGVLSERAELALRYGGITGFQTSSEYSAANLYQNYGDLSSIPSGCATPPTTVLTGGGPLPGPTPAPFWQPDTDQMTPTSSCAPSTIGLGGAQFLASHYVGATTVNIQAGVDVPSYLRALLGNVATVNTTAQFAHAAWPGLIMYCSVEVHNRVWAAVTADLTVTATPPPNAGNNGTCHN